MIWVGRNVSPGQSGAGGGLFTQMMFHNYNVQQIVDKLTLSSARPASHSTT